MGKHENLTGAQRVAKRRAALRAQGLRPKQFWLPNLRDPKVRSAIRADAAALAAQADRFEDIMAEAEALAADVWEHEPPYDWGDEPPPGNVGPSAR